jgi:hypothetical protein
MALEASAGAIKALNLHAKGVLKALHAALDTRLPQSLEALSHHTAQVLSLLALLVQKYNYWRCLSAAQLKCLHLRAVDALKALQVTALLLTKPVLNRFATN